MDQDTFNMSTRKFLKKVGVTSQHEIEKAVEQALSDGKLTGSESIPATVTLTLGTVGLNVKINGQIDLE